jgi:hypothetical protein
LTQISDKVELDNPRLIPYLSFLYDHCLVGEQNLDEDEKAYFVTERGVSVLKVVSPLIKEAQRIEMQNFEAISSALSVVNSGIKKEERPKRKWRLSDFIKIEVAKEKS